MTTVYPVRLGQKSNILRWRNLRVKIMRNDKRNDKQLPALEFFRSSGPPLPPHLITNFEQNNC